MSNLAKEPKYLKKTVNAILQMTQENKRRIVSVKSIRRHTGVDGGNRSAVNFYSRALTFLEQEGVLKAINHSSPRKYFLKDEKKLESLVEN